MLTQHRATQQLRRCWGVKERHAAGAGGRRRAGHRCDPRVHCATRSATRRWTRALCWRAGRSLPPSLRACGRWRRSLRWSPTVTQRIAESGAPGLAQRLRQPADSGRRAAAARAAARGLATAAARHASGRRSTRADELEKLARLRSELEHDLARAYHDLVVARTWLKLTENATPRVRAALQAYLNAVQKIGKGTGKRAVALSPGRARCGRRGEPRGAVLDHAALPGVGVAACRAGMLRPGDHRRSLAVRPVGAARAAARTQDPDRRRRPPGLARRRGDGGGEGQVADAALPVRPGAAVPRADVAGALHLRPRQGRVRAQRRDAQGALPLRGADHRVLQARVLSPRAQAAAACRAPPSAWIRRWSTCYIAGRRAQGRAQPGRDRLHRAGDRAHRGRSAHGAAAPSAWSRCSARSRR